MRRWLARRAVRGASDPADAAAGTTLTDKVLRVDTWNMLVTADALRAGDADAEAADRDRRLLATEVLETVIHEESDELVAWTERWTIDRRGTPVDYEITYQVASDGGVEISLPEVIVGEDAPRGAMPLGGVSDDTVAQLRTAVADQAGVEANDLAVVAAESVTWPDGSIGCPEQGVTYARTPVPGFRVVLEIGGDELHFHAAEGGEFFLCESPSAPAAQRD